MAELSLEGIDPEELLLRLTCHANALFQWFPGGDEKALSGDGSGPEDLAMSVLLRFLDPADQTVRWKSGQKRLTKASLLAFLKTVLRHDFLDLKKSKRYKTTVHATVTSRVANQDASELSLDDVCAAIDSPEGRAIRQEQRNQLLAELAGEPDLQELLMVQLEPEGYQAFTNRDLARLLEIPVAEIVNRKKKLSRRLHGIHAAAQED